jgi:non-specific serine/threonine protein kinase/serine/threonine-protein kinase
VRPDLWPRVTDLMLRALEVPEREHRAWIETEAAGDAELAAEVLRLLHAHQGASEFLEQPLLAEPGAAAAVEAALQTRAQGIFTAGTEIGHYRILREIGRGGMGAVYLGARADDVFDKQVAVKVVPGALVSDALRERFARERHLLAALDHPGIARVLDGGSTSNGLQYLVMEYVDGIPIDTYCDRHGLETAARLRLFVEVCRAVQYAHDHLIVHRDLKVSNVLVNVEGRPKLLDFGIAKLLAASEGPAETRTTLLQAWTPETASPEQVRGEQTTIATDVYGLGALLFRLLTGRAVFYLSGRDAVERARIVCEATPERPSTVAKAIGKCRIPAISGELDAITLKALHKLPARRYRSAEHLAEDIERHLTHRPVLAAPDSWAYRLRKLVARHPIVTAASAVAVTALAALTVVALWQARRAELERDRAQARLTDVRRLANTLIFDLYDRVENSPNVTPLRRFIVQQGLAYLDRLAADAAGDPQLSVELAEAYARLARVQGLRGQSNLGDTESAVSSLNKARALLVPLRSASTVSVEIQLADLRMLRHLASILSDVDRARSLMDEAIERTEALNRRYPDRADVRESLANVYFYAALVARGDAALPLWTEANRAFGEVVARVPDDPTQLRNLALTEKYIGGAHHAAGRLDLARAHYERALVLDRQVAKARPGDRQTAMDLAFDLGNLAAILTEGMPQDLAQAAALYRESLGLRERASAQDPLDVFARQAVGFCVMRLSQVSLQLGDVAAALTYGRRAVDAYESLPDAGQVSRKGLAWLAFGRAVGEAGRRAEACDAFRRAHEYYVKAPEAERQVNAAPELRQLLGSCPPS